MTTSSTQKSSTDFSGNKPTNLFSLYSFPFLYYIDSKDTSSWCNVAPRCKCSAWTEFPRVDCSQWNWQGKRRCQKHLRFSPRGGGVKKLRTGSKKNWTIWCSDVGVAIILTKRIVWFEHPFYEEHRWWRKRKMAEIVTSNIVASQPAERRPIEVDIKYFHLYFN